jgi:AraC family transcriptional regulator
MQPRFVESAGFDIVGKEIRVSMKDGENFRVIPEFWQRSVGDGTVGTLCGLPGGDGTILGVCADFDTGMNEFTYAIATKSTAAPPDGFVGRAIPAATWAVFEAAGALPDSIQNVWKTIMSEFFEVGEYVHAPAPDLEVYPPGNPMASDYRCEVWVPVVRKTY